MSSSPTPFDGLKRPARLRDGDAVAVVSPASPLKRGQRETVERSFQVLESWGLRPVMAPGVWRKEGYLAGPDRLRAAQLQAAFLDEEVRGIFCIRGGYGSMRLLTWLPPRLLRAHPKVFVGFSDITAILLHLIFGGRTVAFHGPTLTCPDLARDARSPTARSLSEATMAGRPAAPIQAEGWAGGVVEGSLVGGCLSILTSLLGTPFAPHLEGAVLFVEDVNEPLYRIDRMLCQLRLAGALHGVRGVVLGAMASVRGASRLREIMLRELSPLDIPILFGVPSGHGEVNLTLPLGTRVRVDGDRGILAFLEPGVEG